MAGESKLASKASDLMFDLTEIVHAMSGTWQKKRDAVIEAARSDDLLSDLNEFLAWFGAKEVE